MIKLVVMMILFYGFIIFIIRLVIDGLWILVSLGCVIIFSESSVISK